MERSSNRGAGGVESGNDFSGGQSDGQTGAPESQSVASNVADQARDRAGQVKEKASQLKATLADKMTAGADRLRQAGGSADPQTGAVANADVKAKVATTVAEGMDNTAEWLRSADLDSIRTGIEGQVKNNPGRTLLIAAGIGYVLGKAFSGRKSD
ncbi:MAG: hypothetical protein M3068_00405 [Gemmatimonadota bacterium]|nr:hypothetical protein [Gemmatimonadota bacterium]